MARALYLGSTSASRKMLLQQARIPFVLLPQNSDESVDLKTDLNSMVCAIALRKMEHLHMPAGSHIGEKQFFLTADTLSQLQNGTIHGKPIDRTDAREKIRAARDGVTTVCTAFCLDNRLWNGREWELLHRVVHAETATCRFSVPDSLIDYYLDNSPGLKAAGAIAIEEFGLQFLQSVHGSYTTIIGLPLYELCTQLLKYGFSFN